MISAMIILVSSLIGMGLLLSALKQNRKATKALQEACVLRDEAIADLNEAKAANTESLEVRRRALEHLEKAVETNEEARRYLDMAGDHYIASLEAGNISPEYMENAKKFYEEGRSKLSELVNKSIGATKDNTVN